MEPAITDPDSEIIRVLVEAVKKNIGKEPRKTICVGGLDLRYYTNKGIQAASYGPGEPNMAHKVDEYIPIESLHKAIDIYVDVIDLLAKRSR